VAQGKIRYRCFLPDLTGFTVPPCTGPNYQQSTSNFTVSPETSKLVSKKQYDDRAQESRLFFEGHSESLVTYLLNLNFLVAEYHIFTCTVLSPANRIRFSTTTAKGTGSLP
jgi:hypothetical protein